MTLWLQAAPPHPLTGGQKSGRPGASSHGYSLIHAPFASSASAVSAQAKVTSPTQSSWSASLGLSNGPWGIVCGQRNSRGGIKLSCSESPENWQEVAGGSPMPSLFISPSPNLSTHIPQSFPEGSLEQGAAILIWVPLLSTLSISLVGCISLCLCQEECSNRNYQVESQRYLSTGLW